MTMQVNPSKLFKLNLKEEHIEELIGKAKLINQIIDSLSHEEVQKNRDEFIAFSEDLNELLEEIDEILMKRYIKSLDELFEAVEAIIETISQKMGEYSVKSIIIKSANEKEKKGEEFISLDEAMKELYGN